MNRSLFFSLLMATGLMACQEQSSSSAPEPEAVFDIQGHRGCRGLLPENSIAGFLNAIDIGVTTLELDVVISKDSQVLLSHEPWLSSIICKRPDGEDVEEGSESSWNLFQMTYEEIRQCDCGQRPHPRFPEQTLQPSVKPLLSEVFETVEAYLAEKNLPPVSYNIETKSDPRGDDIFHPVPEVFTSLLLDVIIEHQLTNRVMIQSFDPRTLQVARRLEPGMTLVLLVEGEGDPQERIDQLGFVPEVYSPEHVQVTDSLLSWAGEKEMLVIPWTVNEPEDMSRLIDMGVDGLITDYPDRLVNLMNQD